MATLTVVNGQGTVILHMANDDLRRLMNDAAAHLGAGEGFWARSAADRSSGAKALWVPPGSIVQFELDRGRAWDDPSWVDRRDQRSMADDTISQRSAEDDDTVVQKRSAEDDDTISQRSIDDDDTRLWKLNGV